MSHSQSLYESKFKYAGPAYLQGGMIPSNGAGDGPMQLGERTFTVIEYLQYEPSAYIWTNMWHVIDVCGVEWTIMDGDLMEYYGYCTDCMGRHGNEPLACPFERMID